jgi:hypothetical protein
MLIFTNVKTSYLHDFVGIDWIEFSHANSDQDFLEAAPVRVHAHMHIQ